MISLFSTWYNDETTFNSEIELDTGKSEKPSSSPQLLFSYTYFSSFFFPLREILHQCLELIKKIKLSTVPLYFSFVEKGAKKGIKRSFITADLIKESRENFEGEITGNMLSSHDVAR